VAGKVVTPAASTKQKPIVSVKKPPINPTYPHITAAARAAGKLKNIMTQPFDNVKPANVAKIIKPIRSGGAAGKFKTAATHKATKSDAKPNLSMRMKLKKATSASSRQKLTEKVPNLRKELLEVATEDPDTPFDLASIENPFHAQATSTQYKMNPLSEDLLDVYRDITKLSPVTVNEDPKRSENSSVKRQLIPTDKSKKKFNFVRYSIPAVGLESGVAEELGILNSSGAGKQHKEFLLIYDSILLIISVEDEAKEADVQKTLVSAATGKHLRQIHLILLFSLIDHFRCRQSSRE